MRGTEKISSDHLSRVALVYIRQSTMAQPKFPKINPLIQLDELSLFNWTLQMCRNRLYAWKSVFDSQKSIDLFLI